MKKKGASVAVAVAVSLCAIVTCGALARISQAFGWLPTWGDKEKPATYTITYRMLERDGQTVSVIPGVFFKPDGSYPKTYTSKKGATVDDLNEVTFISDNEDRVFKGWYEDPAQTVAFDGVVEKGQTGDVVLYAKFSVGVWTGFY